MIGPKIAKPTEAEARDAYELVTLRDADTCQRCRRACGWGVTSRHHRKGRGVGGVTTPANLVVLGGTGTTGCHGWATTHPADAITEGWAVPGWADPAEWPGRRWVSTEADGMPRPWSLRLAWVLFDDEGGWVEIPEHLAHELMGGT
ncbi:hypothetical protein [Agromyces sp. NPDC058064]|uniref:hypothetical protein n=1 Tax=Agromyces sp. NPDC058064 TaxID=3346322 RepID=UPI0036DECD3D